MQPRNAQRLEFPHILMEKLIMQVLMLADTQLELAKVGCMHAIDCLCLLSEPAGPLHPCAGMSSCIESNILPL